MKLLNWREQLNNYTYGYKYYFILTMPFGNRKRKKRWTKRPVKRAPRSEEVSSSNYYMSKDDHGVNSKKTPPLPMEEGVKAKQTTNTFYQQRMIFSFLNQNNMTSARLLLLIYTDSHLVRHPLLNGKLMMEPLHTYVEF